MLRRMFQGIQDNGGMSEIITNLAVTGASPRNMTIYEYLCKARSKQEIHGNLFRRQFKRVTGAFLRSELVNIID